MPHLSPMNWIIVPLMMNFLLSSIIVIMWWQYIPKFPNMYKLTSNMKKKNWKWW
uniref:ATP synthase subunit 8 n=1 Tax=Laeonereis culveri TaxID=1859080 RepID=A0A1B0ZF31_9ANNE|nr:ATP synthase subunit 8 [Laeonereis culveri]